jgi:hypothetical protein
MEGLEVTPGPSSRGYAFGEFLCAGCGGIANVIVAEVLPEDWRRARCQLEAAPAVAWSASWRAYVTISLVCQGPADLEAPDEAWDHAGEVIDLLGTGYRPIGLS